MRFTSAALLLASAASLASAAAVQPRYTKEEEWRDYNLMTESLKEDGLCRTYPQRQEPSYSSWADMCEPTCADARALAQKDGDKIFSVSCLAAGAHLETLHDPEGAGYHLGECKCNLPVVNWVGEAVVEALPAIGHVACAVWELAAKEAAQLLLATRGAAAATTGTQTLIKVAKMLQSRGKGVSDWEKWVKERVDSGDACNFSAKKLFEDFTGLDDSVLRNI